MTRGGLQGGRDATWWLARRQGCHVTCRSLPSLCFDSGRLRWQTWTTRWQTNRPTQRSQPLALSWPPHELHVPTASVARHATIAGLLLGCRGAPPLLLRGPAGCGKTSLISHTLREGGASASGYTSTRVPLTHCTTPGQLWLSSSALMEKGGHGTASRRLVIFVDDLHLPVREDGAS